MVKRFVKNGFVVNSTTELVAPKTKPQAEAEAEPTPEIETQPEPRVEQEMPGSFTDEKQYVEAEEPTRTCNCCVNGKCSCSNLPSRPALI